MCLNKPQPEDRYATGTPSIVKIEQYTASSPEHSRTSYEDIDVIEFGPIKVKPRKKPAPTLATGRRSKYEILTPDEERKRNVRRARNRAAAERVRISRLNIEQQLQNQIDALEQQEQQLSADVRTLEHQKLHLQTRLLTHEHMCSRNQPATFDMHSNVDLSTFFPADGNSISYETVNNDKLAGLEFDDAFFNALNHDQLQFTPVELFSSLAANGDLDDFYMD